MQDIPTSDELKNLLKETATQARQIAALKRILTLCWNKALAGVMGNKMQLSSDEQSNANLLSLFKAVGKKHNQEVATLSQSAAPRLS